MPARDEPPKESVKSAAASKKKGSSSKKKKTPASIQRIIAKSTSAIEKQEPKKKKSIKRRRGTTHGKTNPSTDKSSETILSNATGSTSVNETSKQTTAVGRNKKRSTISVGPKKSSAKRTRKPRNTNVETQQPSALTAVVKSKPRKKKPEIPTASAETTTVVQNKRKPRKKKSTLAPSSSTQEPILKTKRKRTYNRRKPTAESIARRAVRAMEKKNKQTTEKVSTSGENITNQKRKRRSSSPKGTKSNDNVNRSRKKSKKIDDVIQVILVEPLSFEPGKIHRTRRLPISRELYEDLLKGSPETIYHRKDNRGIDTSSYQFGTERTSSLRLPDYKFHDVSYSKYKQAAIVNVDALLNKPTNISDKSDWLKAYPTKNWEDSQGLKDIRKLHPSILWVGNGPSEKGYITSLYALFEDETESVAQNMIVDNGQMFEWDYVRYEAT